MMSGQQRIFNKHISKITSLVDFFNGKEYSDIRIEFEENTWRNIPECYGCKHTVDNEFTWPQHTISQQFNPSLNKLQYLEFTTSNVCNQMCTTCSSQFSNQWTLENEIKFGRTMSDNRHILSDNNINKICECLNDLELLVIKGGEPFADIRNYKVIKKLFEVNDTCKILIVTNGSLIPEKYMDIMFRNPKRFDISASIDAIGKRYEWIRSTSWEKTDNTLKELYYQTGIQSNINPVLSIYNAAHLSTILDWIQESEYIVHKSKLSDICSNQVYYPTWANVEYVFTEEQLSSIEKPFCIQSKFDEKIYKDSIKYTQVMNKIRGFDMDIWNEI
jgi:molybdenum cofactor biosynthesis enzyme MoaA